MGSTSFVAEAAAKLAAGFKGQVLRPADIGYEEARKVHNGLVDKRPALSRCQGVSDVVAALDLAANSALKSRFAAAVTTLLVGRPSMAGS
jgi:hypothetical protein